MRTGLGLIFSGNQLVSQAAQTGTDQHNYQT
jgi:hypothetical protein